MTIGIYSLSTSDFNMIYIGQSTNIELRVSQHINMLEKGLHYNYKLQKVYNSNNNLILELVKECSIKELDLLEEIFIKEFDTINNGLNIVSGGSGGGRGTEANPSIYSRKQILEVVDLLCTNLLPKEVELITGVGHRAISSIQSGISHIWVKEEFPDKWKVINDFANNRRLFDLQAQGKNHPPLVDASGVTYNITNISEFSRQHGLDRRSINSVLLGKVKSHKGFKLLTCFDPLNCV